MADVIQLKTEQDTAARDLENSKTSPSLSEREQGIIGEELSAEEKSNIKNNTAELSETQQPEFDWTNLKTATAEDIARNGVLGVGNSEDSKLEKSGANPDARASGVTFDFPNVLHNYASYTYGLSLHALSFQDYNNIVKNQSYTPSNVLIASAGRYNDAQGPSQFTRNAKFSEDFYFHNLSVETVIGLNERSRNTNAIAINFTIIEPYGVTLLDRIIEICKNLNDGNYLEMPYLLQIDFFGSSDDGVPVTPIPNITKRIPIKLYQLDAAVGVQGTTYTIGAYPFNHSAYDETTVSNPVNIEVTASTVAGFFANLEDQQFIDGLKENEQRKEQAAKAVQDEQIAQQYDPLNGIQGPDFNNVNTDSPSSERKFTTPGRVVSPMMRSIPREKILKIKSYTSALNGWQKYQLEQGKITVADVYEFKFDKEIGEAKLVNGGKIDQASTPMTDRKNARAQKVEEAGSEQTAELDTEEKIFSINAGSSIEKVLEYVLRSSNYELGQLINPEDYPNKEALKKAQEELKEKPFKSYKIVPTVELIDYDRKTKRLARKITYYVKAYTVKNLRVPGAPGLKATDPMKTYQYIYTGQNRDIIDFQLTFNTAYYTALTVDRGKQTKLAGPQMEEGEPTEPKDAIDGFDSDYNYNVVMPLIYKHRVADTQTTATGGVQSAKEVQAADVHRSIYTESAGDMLEVALKVVGDPLFIKQDELFYPPTVTKEIVADPRVPGSAVVTDNGSLVMDNGEVYVQLLVYSPTDIDEAKGLTNLESSPYRIALFSGMYKVLVVTSNFEQGVFTQELTLVRLSNQTQFDYRLRRPSDESTQGRNTDDNSNSPAPQLTTEVEDNKKTSSEEGPDLLNSTPDPEIDNTTSTAEDKKLADVADNGEETDINKDNQPR